MTVRMKSNGKKEDPDDNADDNTAENTGLVEKQHRVTLQEAVRLRTAVLVVSWISVVSLLTLGIASFVIGQMSQSSSAFAFALDALLDTMSSIVVIWRYSGSAKNLYSVRRESLACISLGVLFLVSAITITIKAIISIINHEKIDHLETVFYLALVDGSVCSSLVFAKVYLGYKLESRALITDAFNSLVGAIIAITMMIDNKLSRTKYWMMDPIVGLICAVALSAYGIWTICDSVKALKADKQRNDSQELDSTSGETTKTYTQGVEDD